MNILTASCRFAGLNHEDCNGWIYLGSIFGDPNQCECQCHDRTTYQERT